MKVLKLIIKNVFRHKLRTTLTVLGLAIAVMAFGLIQTAVTSWNSGVAASEVDRLVTREAVTIINPLPYSYLEKIKQVPGVKEATFMNWFGGTYIDQSHFLHAWLLTITQSSMFIRNTFSVEMNWMISKRKEMLAWLEALWRNNTTSS